MNRNKFCGYVICRDGNQLKTGKCLKTVAQNKIQNKLVSTASIKVMKNVSVVNER
jgi:hypothetical protein